MSRAVEVQAESALAQAQAYISNAFKRSGLSRREFRRIAGISFGRATSGDSDLTVRQLGACLAACGGATATLAVSKGEQP